ncbi:MAG: CrcB family protein [Acidimicrobiales bacterium]|nr:CrcB family protein [Acidimicrobiales bacterium]
MTTNPISTRDLARVAVGGAVGAAVRWGLLETTAGTNDGLAGPVLLANLVGCGLLGLILGRGVGRSARLLVGAGLCAGLTTFSTFAVEVAHLLRDSDPSGAASYTALSVIGGLVMFLLGRKIGGTTAKEATAHGASC